MDYKEGEKLLCIKDFRIYDNTILFEKDRYYHIKNIEYYYIKISYNTDDFSYFTFKDINVPKYFNNLKKQRREKLLEITKRS